MEYTPDQIEKAREYTKCAQQTIGGFLYFVNNFCKIQDRTSEKPIPFKLWPAQEEVVPSLIKEMLLIILKARQLGLTWLVVAYVVWRAIFNFNELIVIVSGDNESYAVEFLDRVKFIFDNLPDHFKPKTLKRNETTLSFGEEVVDKDGITETRGLNSTIKSLPPTASAGQSKTVSLLVLDEAALNRYVKKIYAAAAPTLEHALGKCIVISNPNKDKPGWSWVRDIYTGSMAGLNKFVRIFLDPFGVPSRGPNFIQEKLDSGMDEEDRIMMYPLTEEEAISAMLGSYFGKVLARHNKFKPGTVGNLIPPEDGKKNCSRSVFEEDTKGILIIWEMPYDKEPGFDGIGWARRYAIGSDVSEGLGQDKSTAYVMDRLHNNRIVAKMASNRIDASEWAKMIYLLANFYNSAGEASTSCVERNGAGQTTVKDLQNMGAPQYVKMIPDTEGKPYTKQLGWTQTQQSKHELMGDLKAYFRHTTEPIRCGILIDESSTFIRHDNGRLGHEDGKNDDHVFGAALALQCAFFIGEPPRLTGMTAKAIEEREELIAEVGGATATAMKEHDEIRRRYSPDEDEEEYDEDDEDEIALF